MNLTDKIADLSLIWKQASLVFPYFDRIPINWDDAYRNYLPNVMSARTDREFHLLLAEFLALLGDGHTDYSFPKSLVEETGFLPFSLRFVHGVYCIDGIIPEHRQHLAAQVLSVNGVPFHEILNQVSQYSYHVGSYIPQSTLHRLLPFFLRPTDNRLETDAGSFSFDLLPEKAKNMTMATQTLYVPHEPLHIGKLDIRRYGGILYIKLNDFLYADAHSEVRNALQQASGVRGLILDLRENIGGMTMYGAKIAELLIPGEFHACKKRTRAMRGIELSSASQIARWSQDRIQNWVASGNATQAEMDECQSYINNTHCDQYIDSYGAETNIPLFSAPCVILTSRHTISAAEDFVAMFRTNNRATIIGTETCGTTGTPLLQSLSCGGQIRICSVGYKLFDGTEFVGCGIHPDIFAELSQEDLRQEYDSVLKAGLDFLNAQ